MRIFPILSQSQLIPFAFFQLLLISRHWSALHVSIIALSISSYFLVVLLLEQWLRPRNANSGITLNHILELFEFLIKWRTILNPFQRGTNFILLAPLFESHTLFESHNLIDFFHSDISHIRACSECVPHMGDDAACSGNRPTARLLTQDGR